MKKYILSIFTVALFIVIIEAAMLFFLQNNNTLQFISAIQTTSNAFFSKNSSIALFTSIINANKNPLCESAKSELIYSGIIRNMETLSRQHAMRISLIHPQVKSNKLITMTVNTDALIVTKMKKKVGTNTLVIGSKIKIIYNYDQKNESMFNTIEILQ